MLGRPLGGDQPSGMLPTYGNNKTVDAQLTACREIQAAGILRKACWECVFMLRSSALLPRYPKVWFPALHFPRPKHATHEVVA